MSKLSSPAFKLDQGLSENEARLKVGLGLQTQTGAEGKGSQGQPGLSGNGDSLQVVITDRDLEMLRFLGKGGPANVFQLKRKFWPASVSEHKCRQRLALLQKAGLVQVAITDAHKRGEQVFLLSKPGARALFSGPERKFFYTELPARHEIKQQLISQEARIRIEESLALEGKVVVEWKNEHELRSEAIKAKGGLGGKGLRGYNGRLIGIADAQMQVVDKTTGESQKVDIEIDGYYYGKMLEEKVSEVLKTKKPYLWVTTQPRRAARVQELSGGNTLGGELTGPELKVLVIEDYQ